MTQSAQAGGEVLRGVLLQAEPLHLGRAKAPPLREESPRTPSVQSDEDALQQARATAVREGREEGLRAGRAAGLREGHAQAAEEVRLAVQRAITEATEPLQAERERLQQLAEALHGVTADAVAAAQDEIVGLCFETLCRVFGEAAIRPDFVRAQLSHVLALHGKPDVILHVHPQDADLLAQRCFEGSGAVEWCADPEVALGGCILHAPAGGLDARLETVLAACRSALLEGRNRWRAQASAGERP